MMCAEEADLLKGREILCSRRQGSCFTGNGRHFWAPQDPSREEWTNLLYFNGLFRSMGGDESVRLNGKNPQSSGETLKFFS